MLLKQLCLIVIGTFLVSILFFYFYQRNLIYFPSKEIPQLNNYHAEDMQVIHLTTKNNLSLTSWYKPAQPHKPTLLFLHGNAGHIGYRMPLVREFLNHGFGVLLLEYRGYGGNKGTPTEKGLYQDAQAALQFLQENQISHQQIILYGESLGTGVATQLASQNSFCNVILQSPFTSLTSLARYHYPWILLKPIDNFNSLERIHKINTPLLIAHGTHDQIVPYQEGMKLFNAANEPKTLFSFEGKNHNDLWDDNFFKKIMHYLALNGC